MGVNSDNCPFVEEERLSICFQLSLTKGIPMKYRFKVVRPWTREE